jgi:DNA-binding NarL/FixJ family response regulator
VHTPGDTGARGRAVWLPSQEVAGAIRRATDAFVSRKGAVSGLSRGGRPASRGTRVAICDDSPLFLAGLDQALRDLGMSVSHQALDVATFERGLQRSDVDLVIIDIAQPPTFTVEGILVAQRLRAARPGLPILLLSSDVAVEGAAALATLEADGRSLGFLIKDRLAGGPVLYSAVSRLLEGGTLVDPEVVASLIAVRDNKSALDRLSGRERQTLELVAQGMTNAAIARHLFLSPKTVEANIASLFTKLGLPAESSANRRVLATLTYLQALPSTTVDVTGVGR